jgi:hypothetical protein
LGVLLSVLLFVLLFRPCLLLFVVLLWVAIVIRWPILRGTGEGDKSQGQGQRDKFCDSRRFHREYLSVPAACTTAGCWWC